MSAKPILISEIFGPTVQGEGRMIGKPTIFVRTGGCDYRCHWCDTLFAVDTVHAKSWQKMTPREIMAEVDHLSGGKPMSITLSGGNPAMQPLDPLLDLGRAQGYRFALETQGSLARDWFSKLSVLTLSPKPPSSGEETDWDILAQSVAAAGDETDVTLKVVVFDEVDYAYARDVARRFPKLSMFVQPGNHTPGDDEELDMNGVLDRLRWLAEKVAQDRWLEATVLPQLHVLAWGNLRGV